MTTFALVWTAAATAFCAGCFALFGGAYFLALTVFNGLMFLVSLMSASRA